jgi:hypothetical protein
LQLLYKGGQRHLKKAESRQIFTDMFSCVDCVPNPAEEAEFVWHGNTSYKTTC